MKVRRKQNRTRRARNDLPARDAVEVKFIGQIIHIQPELDKLVYLIRSGRVNQPVAFDKARINRVPVTTVNKSRAAADAQAKRKLISRPEIKRIFRRIYQTFADLVEAYAVNYSRRGVRFDDFAVEKSVTGENAPVSRKVSGRAQLKPVNALPAVQNNQRLARKSGRSGVRLVNAKYRAGQ